MKPIFYLTMLAWGAFASVYAATMPNVVIIYADDMGYGDLRANMPDCKMQTPALDGLAAEGIRFTDGHSSSGVCTPSRFALLTGQHHWRRFHGIVKAFEESSFEADDFTLPKLFKREGYATAAVGKWHLGWNWQAIQRPNPPSVKMEEFGKIKKAYKPEAFDWSRPIPGGPLSIGFDYYFGDGTINFPPFAWIENDKVLTPPTVMFDPELFEHPAEGPWGTRNGPMATDWNPYDVLPRITDKAVEWIGKQSADQPFFLYYTLPSPHVPVIPNKEYRGKTEVGAYGDFILETDVMCGRILQALKDGGFEDNTIVVFSSDNGPEWMSASRLPETGHWSSGPLRGIKRDLFEGGHRVPFVIRWPGVVKAGSVSDETISQVDLTATFAAILGISLQPNEAIDSYNLLPLLKGETVRSPLRVATVQNTFAEEFALRQGDWMFIDAPRGQLKGSLIPDKLLGYMEKDTTPGLLYNLKEDLSQHHNLYEKYPEKVQQMKALLNHYVAGEPCAPHAADQR